MDVALCAFGTSVLAFNAKEGSMNALEAKKLNAAYQTGKVKSEVLKDFSLAVGKGAFEALMGPSGSGKSTFLHIASGLLSSASGELLVDGADVTKMSDSKAAKFRRAHMGVVFQDFNLVETLSVAENIVLPARLDREKPDLKRLAELVTLLGLEGKENRKPAELSGGERQKTAIARALFRKPGIVLADEPTGNLDVKSSQSICSLLGELNKREDSAILLVTHDPVVAAVADKVHFLKDGAIAASFDTEHDAAKISARYLETYN